MNTQLQRMMAVLFLFLTIIAVIVLFWLPVSNDSNRILIAKENPSDSLLGLDSPASETAKQMELGFITTDLQPIDANSSENLQANKDLVEDDRILRRELELVAPVGVPISVAIAEPTPMGKSGKSFAPASVKTILAKDMPAQVPNEGSYTYDVMGNKRAYIKGHTVKQNDWFSTIADKYWDDLFMWPDLYMMNFLNMKSGNPDLIYPGEQVSIYESLTVDGDFSTEDRRTLLSAYLKVYKMYKQIGEHKDLAAAQLLASAVRYDKDFLKNYSGVIVSKDKELAERLIREQKFLD